MTMSRENSPYIRYLSLRLESLLRILLLKKIFKVFADPKSGGNVPHKLGCRKEYLPYVTVLYLEIENSDCRKE